MWVFYGKGGGTESNWWVNSHLKTTSEWLIIKKYMLVIFSKVCVPPILVIHMPTGQFGHLSLRLPQKTHLRKLFNIISIFSTLREFSFRQKQTFSSQIEQQQQHFLPHVHGAVHEPKYLLQLLVKEKKNLHGWCVLQALSHTGKMISARKRENW